MYIKRISIFTALSTALTSCNLRSGYQKFFSFAASYYQEIQFQQLKKRHQIQTAILNEAREKRDKAWQAQQDTYARHLDVANSSLMQKEKERKDLLKKIKDVQEIHEAFSLELAQYKQLLLKITNSADRLDYENRIEIKESNLKCAVSIIAMYRWDLFTVENACRSLTLEIAALKDEQVASKLQSEKDWQPVAAKLQQPLKDLVQQMKPLQLKAIQEACSKRPKDEQLPEHLISTTLAPLINPIEET